jgi:hypothetical protein
VRPTPGSQLALFTEYDYHPFITDRQGSTLELEADHRRHAEVEPASCDLKHGAGLEHLPSGRFAANAAWLGLVGIAYDLARWTGRLGVDEARMTTKTLRVRYLEVPGRLTVSARRPTRHLPARWPWQWPRMSRPPWNFGGGPTGDQAAASSLVGVTAVAIL